MHVDTFKVTLLVCLLTSVSIILIIMIKYILNIGYIPSSMLENATYLANLIFTIAQKGTLLLNI